MASTRATSSSQATSGRSVSWWTGSTPSPGRRSPFLGITRTTSAPTLCPSWSSWARRCIGCPRRYGSCSTETVYTIEGKTFLAFGGVASIDKASRQNRRSWWAEEIPTRANVDRGVRSLKTLGGKVDYVITHTAPREVVDTVIGKPLILGAAGREQDEARFDDPTVAFLMEFRDHVDLGTLKEWFFGHFHTEAVFRGSVTGFLYHGLYMDFARVR